MPKTIGIIGTRRRDTEADFKLTRRAFAKIWKTGDKIVSGGCRQGGDRFAEMIAAWRPRMNSDYAFAPELIIHYPDKSKLDPALPYRVAYARIAYARDALIARDADVLIACVAPDRKGGTENTIKSFCKKLGQSEAQLIKEGRLILV